MFGRRIIMTTLDPIPPLLRSVPGCVAMNQRELEAVQKGHIDTIAFFVATLQAADAAEARDIYVRRAPRRRRRNVSPSTRLALTAAIMKPRGSTGREDHDHTNHGEAI